MALSPQYSWPEPDNSSLVKNGAQDIRALGDAIDTSVWNVGYGQAGKNKIINGDFSIWQRGTSFSNPVTGSYLADRFFISYNGSAATRTYSQQTFTPGTAPVAGYEGTYFLRYARTVAGSSASIDYIGQKIEDVRIFAGQTATLSFWAKVDSGTPNLTLRARQNFGSGGSALVDATDVTVALSTSWTRYTATFAIPSISGKVVGTNSHLEMQFRTALNTIQTLDLYGIQMEYGSKATPFQTASGGSIQNELAMCQRYYQRYSQTAATQTLIGQGSASSTTTVDFTWPITSSFRVFPTALDTSNVAIYQSSNATKYSTGTFSIIGSNGVPAIRYVHGSGVFTANNVTTFVTDAGAPTVGYVGLSAEL
jgi:hypothetical protein